MYFFCPMYDVKCKINKDKKTPALILFFIFLLVAFGILSIFT